MGERKLGGSRHGRPMNVLYFAICGPLSAITAIDHTQPPLDIRPI